MMADNHSVDTDIDDGDYNEIQVHSALSVFLVQIFHRDCVCVCVCYWSDELPPPPT